eukprot:5543207-Prymnesium_polylepis.2
MAARSCSRSRDSAFASFLYSIVGEWGRADPTPRSPITEAHAILWGHGHRRGSAHVAQSLVVTPLWPNGSGASRSLGAPQSRIG